MRYSWIVVSSSVRTVTCGSSAGSSTTIIGGGGGSSSGTVPGGRVRAGDWAAAPRAAARSVNARRVRMAGSFREGSLPLERKLRFAFGRRRLETAELVVVEDRVHDRLRIVDDAEKPR